MNTIRMIPALLLALTLQACGGGDDDAPAERATRECAADLTGSFDGACQITVNVPARGAIGVLAIGTLRVENTTDVPQPYMRTVYLLIGGTMYAPQLLQGVVLPHQGVNVPFSLAQPLVAGMASGSGQVSASLGSIEHGISLQTVVHGVVMSTF